MCNLQTAVRAGVRVEQYDQECVKAEQGFATAKRQAGEDGWFWTYLQSALSHYGTARDAWHSKFGSSGVIEYYSTYLPEDRPLIRDLQQRYPSLRVTRESDGTERLRIDDVTHAAWAAASADIARAQAVVNR